MELNGIKQSFSPIYHPAANGAAENAVKLCKRAIIKAYRDKVDIHVALQTFLLTNRNTIHSTTGETPAMILQKRRLRSRLDLLRNDHALQDRVHIAQDRQAQYAGGVKRHFDQGDIVWSKGYGQQDKWLKGRVHGREGSRRYVVEGDNGQFIKRHVDQIRRRSRFSDIACPDIGTDEVKTSGDGDVMPPRVDEVTDGSRDDVNQRHKEAVEIENQAKESISEAVVRADNSNNKPSTLCSPSLSVPELHLKRERKPVIRYGFEFD